MFQKARKPRQFHHQTVAPSPDPRREDAHARIRAEADRLVFRYGFGPHFP
ncbi:hypothetical protein [Microbacterium gorillae]|nr:hypothetical protein [Microbacterium gorillae]